MIKTLTTTIHDMLMFLGDRSRLRLARNWLRAAGRPNAVFIWIPKTAGTSMKAAMAGPQLMSLDDIKYRFCGSGPVTFGHMYYSQLVNDGYVPKSFDASAYKFTIVRNPYARAASLHRYLKEQKLIPPDMSFLSFCRKLKDQGCDPIGLYNVKGLSQCNPQVRWTENIELDYVAKMETLNRDIDKIMENIRTPRRRFPHLNRTTCGSQDDIYDEESRAIVEDLYEEDFRAFGYTVGEGFPSASA